jgi:hypothetical protein
VAEHPFDRGGQDDGKLTVSIERFYGEDYVSIDLEPGATGANLTASQAREVAADLIANAEQLDSRSA